MRRGGSTPNEVDDFITEHGVREAKRVLLGIPDHETEVEEAPPAGADQPPAVQCS